MNLYLIGFRCTGKTTVGRLLALHLEWRFRDTDEEIVARDGRPVREIVRQEGWERFRALEGEAIRRASSGSRNVVATGGGVVLREDNIRVMRDSGILLWLRATPETIRERILRDRRSPQMRPSLTRQGTLEEIEGVLAERVPIYESATSFVVDTDGKTAEQVCAEILEEL
jgi:shikimate kinase